MGDASKEDPTLYSALKVEQTARRIMEHGDVLKFLVRQAQRNHVGDTDVIKHLVASICSTNSSTSAGIQPELNGSKGYGKTDAVKAVFHLIPEKWKLAASISSKALYYHQGLPTGAIIFSDDIQWSDDLISTVKRSMGNFQVPQVHFTLDKNRNPLPQTMPARLVWWLSSVESVADDQLKDRQYSLDIDEGSSHLGEVSDYLRISRSKKVVRFCVDWRIAVARQIIDNIKDHEVFKVVIDCAAAAEWKVKEDHRTQNKFWDLVEAFAILRYKQRFIDSEGWLHATVEDFDEAKTIFMRRKANHQTHLTNAQTKIVTSILGLQNEPDGATQARIAEDIGITYQAVQKALNAIEANTRFVVHEAGVHGIKFYRCTVCGLEVVYNEGDIVILPENYKDPYNPLQPRYNHDTTIHTTIKTNNGNTNNYNIQPKKEEYSNEGSDLSKESKHCCTPEIGCNGCITPIDSDQQVVKKVVSRLKQQQETVVPSEDNGIGPNPSKGPISVIVRVLKDIPQFVGENLRHAGDVITYGPFKADDLATLPSINASGLVTKGVAIEVKS